LKVIERKEQTVDQFWKTGDRFYRVSIEQYQEGTLNFQSAKSYRGIPGLMLEEFPEVTGMTRLTPVQFRHQ
jgi:hypothetical protein